MHSAGERFKKIKKVGVEIGWLDDVYHKLLTISWTRFTFLFFGFFILFNLCFAILFWLIPESINNTGGSLFEAFSFSVQTFSTVGYGVYAPHGNSSHVLVIIESMLSVFTTAVLTGLIFAKFARPSARVVFSEKVIITNFDGKRVLMFRMGNLRGNQIVEADIHVVALVSHVSPEGQSLRRQVDLPVLRNNSLFFALTWTVIHVINESSPFFGLTQKDIEERNLEVAASLVGYDESFSQTIHANCIYSSGDYVFDNYFEDIIRSQGRVVELIDYTKFNSLSLKKT